jgi:uncharacterized membrane protein
MVLLFCILAYLLIGAAVGLIHEEYSYRRSSQRYRPLADFVFSACLCAVLWPVAFIVANRNYDDLMKMATRILAPFRAGEVMSPARAGRPSET